MRGAAVSTLVAVLPPRAQDHPSAHMWVFFIPGPHGGTPVFVVTDGTKNPPADSVYTFVSDIETAIQKAKQTAKDRDVRIMGGAYMGKSAIRAGLVDEVVVHIAPVLFGKGIPLFGNWDDAQHSLKILEVMDTPLATHIRYKLVKSPT